MITLAKPPTHRLNWHYHNTELTQFRPTTGPSRCFPFWQELLSCYVVNSSDDDASGKKKCVPAMEDYYECLHHRKEVRQPRPSASLSQNPSEPPWLTRIAFSTGCESEDAAGCLPTIRGQEAAGESPDGRPNTESWVAGQGGRHQEGAGDELEQGRRQCVYPITIWKPP